MSMRALCCCERFSRLIPSLTVVMNRRGLAAVALEVSFWARGSTVRKQTTSTTSPRGSVSPKWVRSWEHSFSLKCVGGLAFLTCVCLRWFPALVSGCLCVPHHCISL